MTLPRPAVYAAAACALTSAAAAVSFVRGSWVGIVWVLLAGLTSNLAWYATRRRPGVRGIGRRRPAAGPDPAPSPSACGSGGACGGCTQKIC
ncbi:hypothetical protein [Streptomyces bambusae]|uniref:Secreted protein n=1 Tax=Streptomyces bambusae TaxID=1550616 RepID=A0ABS6YYP9_9ACTN|nr:hypothetical protein [Streptomyces bambusae]MBW5480615.1 hypothetical protein [Streptomyces bambusae]